MIKHFFYPTIVLFFTLNSFSQKKAEPTIEDEKFAKSLKEIYPDASIIVEESNEYFKFSFDKKNEKVKVNRSIDESIINIDPRANIQKYYFYNNESSINKFKIKWKNGKEINKYIKDEAYTSNDLFHNDSRVKYVNLTFPLLGYKYLTEVNKSYNDINPHYSRPFKFQIFRS